MKCLLLTKYARLGSSSRVRFFQFLPYLQAHGVEILTSPLLGDNYVADLYAGRPKDWQSIASSIGRRLLVLGKSRRFDFLWIESELFPWFPPWAEMVLNLLEIPYVIDMDDAVFHRYDLHSNRIVNLLLGRKIDVVLRGAAQVVAGNSYLAERAIEAGAKRVELVPSVVNVERYPIKSHSAKELVSLGWIGSPSTQRYLRLIEPALRQVCAEHAVELVTVGANRLEIEGVSVRCLPWSEEAEAIAVSSFDLGIMPLADTPWERGKCGYKLVQYMACGLPVVASSVGVNREIVQDGVNGFLATSMDEWVNRITRLCEDFRLRAELGQAGRKTVEQYFSLEVFAPRLLNLLKTVR